MKEVKMKKPEVTAHKDVLKRIEMAARELLCDVDVLDYERKSALLAVMDVAEKARKTK